MYIAHTISASWNRTGILAGPGFLQYQVRTPEGALLIDWTSVNLTEPVPYQYRATGVVWDSAIPVVVYWRDDLGRTAQEDIPIGSEFRPLTSAEGTSLPRWMFASVADYLTNSVTSLPILVEGVGEIGEAQKWLELFFDGPRRLANHGQVLYYLDVLVGCQVRLNLNDVYAISDLQGAIMTAFKTEIPVYRYGPPEDTANDQSLVGCLKLRDDVAHPIDGMSFGIIQHRNIELRRATVEGQFVLELET